MWDDLCQNSYVWERYCVYSVYTDHFVFWIVCQYGRKGDDKAATTPLVEHAPAPGKGKRGKKDGKKSGKKDNLEDLKQELEMVHSIKYVYLNYVIAMYTMYMYCYDSVFATIPLCTHYCMYINGQTCLYITTQMLLYIKHFCFNHSSLVHNHQGLYRSWKNLESPGILLWHFLGLESPGKRPLVLESSGNLLTSTKRYEVYGRW